MKPNPIDWSGSRALVQQLSHAKLKSALNRYGRGQVLDLGCGDKPYQRYCRSQSYLGIDRHGGDKRGDFFKLHLGKNCADTIICTQVIEHLPDPRRLFKLAYKLLKIDSHLVLAAPFVWPLHDEPRDYWRFSPYGLKQLCREANLTVISCQPLGGYLALIWQLVAILLERPAYGRAWTNRLYRACLKFFFSLVQPLVYRLDQIKPIKGAAIVYLLVAKK
ncbi:hypothetical protein A2752_04505 [Candidatus Uhrbacteria bacterium RIFCSPHIGHO2_01_FULL_46_23]|nr:MAG: hypothetical protein A2752_04505 [Candidatus Uhrbacteria bacterium RIFCSPHIGHO2_01_FULL_46_23]